MEERSWVRIQTAHFEVLTDVDEAEAREIADRLELSRAVLGAFAPGQRLGESRPRFVLFSSRNAFRELSPPNEGGTFVLPTARGTTTVVRVPKRLGNAVSSSLHEYVHLLLRNTSAVRLPVWYDEGMAELMSTIDRDRGQVRVGRVPRAYVGILRLGGAVGSPERALTQESSDPRALGSSGYFTSWAVTHYFVVGRIAGELEGGAIAPYLDELEAGAPLGDAFAALYDGSFDELGFQVQSYLSRGVPVVSVPVDSLSIDESPQVVQNLSPTEVATALGQISLQVEGQRERARSSFERALRYDASNSLARAELALSIWENEAESLVLMQEAVRADPDSVDLLAAEGDLYALQLRGAVGDADTKRAAARHSYRACIAREPRSLRCHVGLGTTYLDEDGEEGIAALLLARELQPWAPEASLWLARLLAQRGRAAEARTLLEEALRWPLPYLASFKEAQQELRLTRTR